MPIDWTDLERIGVLIGEAISDDVSAWSEPMEQGDAATMQITRGGADYEIVIRRADAESAIACRSGVDGSEAR